MHKIEIFNVGNGDSALVELANGRLFMIDFCDTTACAEKDDPRVHLSKRIREKLASKRRDYIDVLAVTHLDLDHIAGATDFFYLEHAAKYQSDDRVRISTLWVPAGALMETDLGDEARIIQAEARYRLKVGAGIRVFSRPEMLREWCRANGIDFEARKHLITDAGRCAPEFSLSSDGMEAFIHAPLARRLNDGGKSVLVDRNPNCLVFQARFDVSGSYTDVLFTGDMTAEGWADIVEATKEHGNEDRLAWDLHAIAHHCSYKSIGAEKGEDETAPTAEVEWLFKQGRSRAYVISSSEPIPSKGSQADKDAQPPHRQAAAFYKRMASKLGGKFIVTMEHPTQINPKPAVFDVTRAGLKLILVGTVASTASAAPIGRAGKPR